MSRQELVPRLIANLMRRLGIMALAVSWIPVLSWAADAFDIIGITDNGITDGQPAISGSSVAWVACDGGVAVDCADGDWEIYLWDGATTTQIYEQRQSRRQPSHFRHQCGVVG